MTNKVGPKSLTEQQIADIFSGKIKNMKEVGGADAPVEIILVPKQTATQSYFESKILKGKISGNVKTLSETSAVSDMIDTIAANPAAIGFGPIHEVNDKISTPEHPVIGRPITFIFRAQGQIPPKINKLLKFIQEKGPKLGVAQ